MTNGKSLKKIDCYHQDSNQGPSLVASDALTTELWCSCHPSRDRSTFSSDYYYYYFPFVSFPQTSEDFMTWGSPRARVYVKCLGTVRAASHPPVWIHRKCELRNLKKNVEQSLLG